MVNKGFSMNNFNFQFNIDNFFINQNSKRTRLQTSNETSVQNFIQDSAANLVNQQKNPKLVADFNELHLNLEQTKMNSEDLLKYLQKLMNMPKTIEEALVQVAKNNDVKNGSLQSFLEIILSIKVLGNFLNKNSSQAIQTLMQTIALTTKTSQADTKQLREVLSILSTLQKTTQNSDIIKDFLLLYVPLTPQVFNEEVNFTSLNKEEQNAIDNSYLTLMFQTRNLSNILCCINKDDIDTYTTIYAAKSFPYEKFIKFIDVLLAKSSIKTFFEKKDISSAEDKNYDKKNLKVVSKGNIPIELLILSHIITQTIFMIDDDVIQK